MPQQAEPPSRQPDGRLARGAQTRGAVARRAVDIASLESLHGLSFGRLAADLGLSKSGIQTLFGTKENVQLAAIACARKEFIEAVVRPALAQPAGTARLRALVAHWISYAQAPLFLGGCFRAANMADFDSQPGPVHDALFHDREQWLNLLATQLRAAIAAGDIADVDCDFAAFQIDAVLCAANTALRLGEDSAISYIERTVAMFLRPPAPAPGD